MGIARRIALSGLAALLVIASVGIGPGAAVAATGDVGFPGPSYSGAGNVPTSDKPQSKLWYAHGSWWADMFDTASGTWHIFRLDRATQQWQDTGVVLDDRANTLADVLWDGTYLYVASHVVTISGDSGTKASQPNSPGRLYRYSWSADRGYTRDAGFPVTITSQSSESLTIDKDTTGTLWATWTQVSATADGSYTSAVYVNSTTGADDRWGTPFVVPVAGSTVAPDDISSVVAFGRNRIGILWSNQLEETVYWAVHDDGASRTSWRGSPAVRGNRQADDHVNIKAVQADTSGRVFAVVKTSLDGSASASSTDPQLLLLNYKPGTGAWSSTPVATISDCHTRALLLLDEAHQQVHVFATAPSSGGCPYPGAPGTIYQKSASMTDPVFATGRGTPVIREAASPNMNDVTSTKQSVTADSGIVLLASNKATQRYWHADLAVRPPAPVASFTASSTAGQAPLPVRFTDTSPGGPTAWAWDFGDGTTSTDRNPAHTYAQPGNYTVTLTVTNATATSAPASASVVVTAAAPAVTAGASSTAASSTAVTDVTVPRPAGVAAGTVLIAQLTVDGAPTMAAVPVGWATLTTTHNLANLAKVYAYYHVVTDPAAEPAHYTWRLTSAQRWGAGMTAFIGVDTTTPFDTPASSARDTTYDATAVTVPGISTVTDGAMLVGGAGLDHATATVTPPTAWTEAWESTGGQTAQLAHRQTRAAGLSGDLTWTLSRATAAGAWVRALRPAPAPPAAAFTTSSSTGEAPLLVRFTDTSMGTPTTWSWSFGDGTTSAEQHPTHTYAEPGTYTVTLTASNALGSGQPATETVTVTAPPVVPKAAFTTSPTDGQAPLPVQFTDTSTGTPTAWAWDFGDGATATDQHPTHTYTAAGTYTVTLTATNRAGSSAPITATVTVTAAPPRVTAGGSTTATSTTATTTVTVPRPAATAAGDVLIAQITTNGAPSMTTVPAGWSPVLPSALSVHTGARVFAYYHVMGAATGEPASWTWQLSGAQKWNAGMTAFSGVDTANPFDTAASTAVNKTYTSSALTVPGVTTVSAGAMLVGGIGLDSAATAVGAPTGWTEAFESSGAQVAELSYRPTDAAGPSGSATWTLGKSTASTGWVRALRPATTSRPPAAPSVPAASFTASATSGPAPLAVRFTDTSTGTPTSWAWTFGDGGTAATQHPEHVYTNPGTYTVSLVATNSAGSSRPATVTVTVGDSPPPPPPATGGGIRAGASATASSTAAATAVAVPRPAGVAAGDVLIAQITSDGAPSMSSVPAGWSPVLSAPLAIGTGARVFVYSHVVSDVAAEPAGYAWQLSAPYKWGAALTAFSGVDTANPFDTAASTRIEKTYGSTVLTVPGVVTTTAGAVLIGGLGMDSSAAGVSPPVGWTETAESSGAQTAELAHAPTAAVGPTGEATWTLPKATAAAGWLRALRPAS